MTTGEVGVLCLSDPAALADDGASSVGEGDSAGLVVKFVDKGVRCSKL